MMLSFDELFRQLQRPEQMPIHLGLDQPLALLAALGKPHLAMPPVVHVAGTNGKGSTLAFVRSLLETAGYRVHVYTSPHLVHFHERIIVAGQPIDDASLRRHLATVVKAMETRPATFFEAITALAFLAFAETPADFVLLETGMGGRLDATNVIPDPVVTAITPISRDHAEFLGDSIAEIAAEKAGILKRSAPCIVAPQPPEALSAIVERATEIGATLLPVEPAEATLGLAGLHQRTNAAVALGIVKALGVPLDPHSRREGLLNAHWPGRLQNLSDHYPQYGVEVWLDGGHNAGAAEVMAAWIASRGRPFALVCGMMARKDARAFFRRFRTIVTHVYTLPMDEPDAYDPYTLAEHARAEGLTATTVENLAHAMQLNAETIRANLLVCGSLYLAGAILGYLQTNLSAQSPSATPWNAVDYSGMSASHEIFRRINEHLVAYWDELRHGKRFPAESQVDPAALSDVWDHCFLVSLRGEAGNGEYKYTYLGKALIDVYGDEMNGNDIYRRVVDAPTGDLAQHFGEVHQLKEPIDRAGEFTNKSGVTIKYRACMVPLGTGDTVDYVLGGMKWRAF